MKTIQHSVSLKCSYPLKRLGALDSLLFFDIETTGFSRAHSMLYLIGCISPDQKIGGWEMIQWFADTPEAEPELLTAFFTYLKGYTTLVHFNGDMFDIPFLLERCRQHGLPYDFTEIESVDIYRRIRPYKGLLGLDSLKQKSIEHFLELDRTDQYSGGQLIQVYHQYLHTQDPGLYDLLLLHNEEDLKGMPLILPILSYPDMLEPAACSLTQQRILSEDASMGKAAHAAGAVPAPCTARYAELVFTSPCTIPVPFQSPGRLPGSLIQGRAGQIACRIPLYEGELRYFYPDPKDYYYLPFEDMAVHKSVGRYVAREARKKATPRTCYTKKSGLFLPQLSRIWQPAFQKEYKDAISYVLYSEKLFQDPEAAGSYLRQLLF